MKSQLYCIMFCLILVYACQSDNNKNKNNSTIKTETAKHTKAYKNISLSTELLNKGLKLNNSEIKDSPAGGFNNVLSLQVIFENDFDGILYVTVSDEKGNTIGRAKLEVEGQKGRVDYFDFTFNKTVKISEDSTIIVE